MNTLITVVNQWGESFVRHAGLMMIQVGILIGLLWLLDRWLCGRIRASLRYGLWMLVLVKLVLSPYLSLPTGVGHWIHFQSENTTVRSGSPLSHSVPLTKQTSQVIPVTSAPQVANNTGVDNEPAMVSLGKASVSLTWQGIALIGWLVGILALSLGLLIRGLSIRKVIRSSETANHRLTDILTTCQKDMRVSLPIELRLTPAMTGPAVCRAWRPIILLPKALADQFPEDKLRAVLLHELCHIKRADLWINWVQTLVQVFYFYNPLVWWANAYIRRVREQAVDEGVLVCLQGRRHCYSHTLIDIAEIVTLRPKLGLGLIGVAESKTRLNERIKLMLNTPIPRHARLGTFGLALIVAVGMVLLPMAAAQSPADMLKGGRLKQVDAQARDTLLKKIQTTTEDMLSSYGQGDLSRFLSHVTLDAIFLTQETEAQVGRGALHKDLVENQNKGLMVHGFKAKARRIFVSGDLVYEVGPYAMAVTTPGVPGMITEFRDGLTIWQKQPDGSYRIRVDAYNRAAVPQDPMNFGAGTSSGDNVVMAYTGSKAKSHTQETLFEQIRQIEKSFHDLFPKKQTAKATDHYTEDATLMVMGYPVFKGKEAIAEIIAKGARETPLSALKQDIIQMGGDENLIYVVNLFRWILEDPSTGEKSSVPGKGVHVWQRQPDGAWKILIDINNTDVPFGN